MTDTTLDEQTTTRDDTQPSGGQRSDSAADRLGGPTEPDTRTSGHDGPAPDTGAATGADEPAALIPSDRARHYRDRWNEIKGDFVDEPRTAVRGANRLVGEILDELEELFSKQRDDIEHGLDSEDTTTEDLRQALGNYRSFFDRLLQI